MIEDHAGRKRHEAAWTCSATLGKGVRSQECEAPEGPFRPFRPDPFSQPQILALTSH